MDWSNPVRAVIPGLEGPVLQVLAAASTPLTGSEVHRRAGTGSNAGVRLALERLVDVGTVTVTPAGSALLYGANRDHLAWPAIAAALSALDPRRHLRDRLVELLGTSPVPGAAVVVHLEPPARRPAARQASEIVHLVVVVPDDALADDVEDLAELLRTDVRHRTGNRVVVHAATASTMLRDVEDGHPAVLAWDEATRARVRSEAERLGGARR